MTRERALELATECLRSEPFEQSGRHTTLATERIADLVLTAVAGERETCAKIADIYADEMLGFTEEEFSAEEIARRIRLRP